MANITKRKDTKNYYYNFTLPDGTRKQGSTGSNKKAEAQKIADDIERKALEEILNPKKPKIKISEAMEYFLENRNLRERTKKGYRESIGRLIRDFGDAYLDEIESHQLISYINRSKRGRFSLRSEMVKLKTIMSYVDRIDQWSVRIPKNFGIQDFESEKPRDRFFTFEEIQKILNFCDELPSRRDNKERFIMYINTGCRYSELHRIRPIDVDFNKGTIFINGTKTEKAKRTVPITEDALPILKRRMKMTPPLEPLFPKKSDCSLRYMFQKAGIENACYNDLRRTYASLMIRGGVDLTVIAKLMGHTDIKMIMNVYGQLYPDAIVNAASAIPSFANASSGFPLKVAK